MDRKIFYDRVRTSLFSGRLTAEQVGGMDALLDAAIDYPVTDVRHVAYIFGGVYHEAGKRMVPVREGFASTDAGARSAVAKLFSAGRISKNYALPVGGVSYYGRGRIQNTHLENYQKLEKRFGQPFVSQPDLLLESEIDAAVTIAGHAEGIWTGRRLADFIHDDVTDYQGARRIVNGTDKAGVIANYAKSFESALKAAGYGEAVEASPEPAIITQPVQEPAMPAATPTPAPSVPLPANPSPTPVEQASKSVGAGKWTAVVGTLWTTISAFLMATPSIPEQYRDPVLLAGVGTLLTTLASIIGAYSAPMNALPAKAP